MAKLATVTAPGQATGGVVTKVKVVPQRIRGFYTDVRTEMKRVTTPSFKEVRATTTVVVITVFIFAAYFFVVDKVIGYGIDHVLRYFTHR